jgi:hypothetical protein
MARLLALVGPEHVPAVEPTHDQVVSLVDRRTAEAEAFAASVAASRAAHPSTYRPPLTLVS